ncbi:MAG: ANTAR domain-containing protein [Oleiphilaceae bacterium]|nr:ANTAR domain-containing protein [Oleiphilaceae bacterium]
MATTPENVRVMLVDNEPDRARLVRDALESQGYNVICQRDSTLGLVAAVAKQEPDLVIIDMDSPDRDTLDTMAAMSEHAPRPIVFFASGQSDSHTIQDAVRAGVSAYIVDGLEQHRVKPIIDVAIARFQSFQALRHELLETRTALDERKRVEQAKGLIMKHQGCDEEEAFRTLRKLAMDRSQRLGQVADDVIGIFAGKSHRKPGETP